MPECPFCSSQTSPFLATTDRNQRLSSKYFEYFKCRRCSLVFLHPIPTDLARFYSARYFSVPKSLAALRAMAQDQRGKIETVLNFSDPGGLLDVGASFGAFCLLAKDAGFEVSAIEQDETCVRFLTDVVGVQTDNNADVCRALARTGNLDVITLWHVIEHLPKPWATLEAVAKALASGGTAVIATPNPNALQLRIFRHRWVHIDAPRHLFLIPFEWIAQRLSDLGLERVHATFNDKESKRHNAYGWGVSLSKYLSRLGPIIAGLASPIENRRSRSAAYTVVYRR